MNRRSERKRRRYDLARRDSSLYPFSPFSEFFEEFDGLVEKFFGRVWEALEFRPFKSELIEEDDHYVVEVGVRDFRKDEVKIGVKDNLLLIGARKILREGEEPKLRYHRFERKEIKKAIALPPDADIENIDAFIDREGFLVVTIPKREISGGREIPIREIERER